MEELDKQEPKKQEQPIPRLNDYSPNTMMIMGAALSGGDPLKMAKMLLPPEEPEPDEESH